MDDSGSQLLNSTITKEEINQLPLVRFEGPIHLIDSPEKLPEAIEQLMKEPVLGFDTETKPSFTKGTSYPPALIQFSSLKEAWLIRINGDEIHPDIINLLKSKDHLKVGVALHDDVKHLQEVTDFKPAGFIDLSTVAYHAGIQKRGLRNMCGMALGIRLSKSAQLSNWAQEKLTNSQLTYAATDAWISLKLYVEFEKEGLLELKAKED